MRSSVTSAAAPAAGALFLISLGMSAVHAATGPASGSIVTLKGVQSSNCIGVKGASTAAGAALQSQGCSGSAFQQWKVSADSSGYYQLVNVGSGQCMDVPSASANPGTFIQQWGCGGGDWQKWQFHDDGAGHYYITSKASGLALDVYQHSTANGAAIDQWAYQGAAHQQWIAGVGTSNALVGFGVGTTGGKGGSVTTVSSCSALKTALASTSAAIVRIPDNTTIDCRTSGTVAACPIACGASDPGKTYYRIPVGTQTCTELGSSSNATSTVRRYDTRIDIQSNKTLQGLGKNSKIVGASLNLANARNVIVSNLTIENINPHLVEGGDALTLDSSRYIWIDHVTTRLISDGHVDMKNSQNVTLSWNHFDGYNTNVCGNQHHYTMLVENSNVTLHHNFFDRASGRNPKLDGTNTRAHLFNNYWLDITYFAINVNTGAQALVENNYFANSAKPHWNNGGYINAKGNVYTEISATDAYRNSGNTVFSDVTMYPYTLQGASGLAGSLATQTGPQ